jgi:hypothetical protein
MNLLKKGPELKRPDLKVPPLVVDLYWDLRERRLLPLVALILVAIVAAPFLLSSSEHGSAPVSAASQTSGTATDGAQLTVVQTDPGLREPSKRLAHLQAKDPFQQHYTAPVVKPGTEPTAQTSTTSTSTTTTTSESAGGSGGGEVTSVPAPSGNGPPSPEHSSGSAGTDNSTVTVFAFAVDLKVSKTTTKSDGEKEKSEPETRQRVLPAMTLPGKKTQVVTYMGISPKSKKPLFLVSPEVKALFGEAECVSGVSTCQLIELEPSFPETFVYGPNDVRYKINVLKVEPVASGHL